MSLGTTPQLRSRRCMGAAWTVRLRDEHSERNGLALREAPKRSLAAVGGGLCRTIAAAEEGGPEAATALRGGRLGLAGGIGDVPRRAGRALYVGAAERVGVEGRQGTGGERVEIVQIIERVRGQRREGRGRRHQRRGGPRGGGHRERRPRGGGMGA